MNWLRILLATFIIIVSISPCSDTSYDDCQDNIDNVESGIYYESCDSEDSCSIFCSCSCCGVQVIELVEEQRLAKIQLVDLDALTSDGYLAPGYYDFWQPPKSRFKFLEINF